MTEPQKFFTEEGEEWRLNGPYGKLHRNDEPAIVWKNGNQWWYQNGQLHRNKGLPAIIHFDGHQEWWINGNRHRLDGPAILYSYGAESWWKNNNCHRRNGPAITYADGNEQWYINHFDVAGEVLEWIAENEYPENWKIWNPEIWVHFNMRF